MAKILKELKKQTEEDLLKKTYALLGEDINKGKIKKFVEIFDYVPKTVLSRDLGLGSTQFGEKRAKDGDLWLVEDIRNFSELTKASPEHFLKLLLSHPPKK